MSLEEWAARWGLPAQALAELAILPQIEHGTPVGKSESNVQSRVRLEAARKGIHLWRNNSGAGSVVNPKDLCPSCKRLARSFIRWGLGNDSPKLNEVVKSADLIGWRPRVITLDDVGKKIAQFTSRECKHEGWQYSNTPEEAAQTRWHAMVLRDGGDSAIVNTEGSL
jgi:hypothetical protein